MKLTTKLMVLGSILVLVLSACQWEKKSVIAYETIAVVFETTRKATKDLCDTSVLSAAECEVIKNQYNLARINYLEAGNILASAIELEIALNQKEYDKLINSAVIILDSINLIIERNR